MNPRSAVERAGEVINLDRYDRPHAVGNYQQPDATQLAATSPLARYVRTRKPHRKS